MSAWCEWSLSMTGRNRNKYLDEILTVLCEIENINKEEYDKIFRTRDSKAFRTNELTRTISTDNATAKIYSVKIILNQGWIFVCLLRKLLPRPSGL